MQTRTSSKPNRIGFWMSEKKFQKFNISEFKTIARRSGYEVVQLDLTLPLENQGPFCVIFHKLTDVIVRADVGDQKSVEMMSRFERYLEAHPEVPVVDPLERVRRLLDRYSCYLALSNNPRLTAAGVFAPTSIELTSNDVNVNLVCLQDAGVQFPFVCKPSISHGSSDAHKMSIIFNEAGVADCKPPCVAQSFINHNAVLYKIYCVGSQHVVLERPSLKNFYSFASQETIFFSTADVSKSDSTSSLSVLDADDPEQTKPRSIPNPDKFKTIVDTIADSMGIQLIGIDVVIENGTDRYAIIDLNAYPGCDGFPNFFDSLLRCLEESMKEHRSRISTLSSESISPTVDKFTPLTPIARSDQDDSGFDTSDSSDEKIKHLTKIR